MARLQTLLFISALLPLLNGFPLEDESSTYGTKQQPHDLKVNPLLAIDVQQQKHENDSIDKDNNSSTEPAVREETHIEVLLPGSQQLNSSVLEALLIGPSSTPADTGSRGEHLQHAETSHYKAEVRPVRDTYSENEGDDSSEEKPSKIPFAVPGSTVAPVLYSAYGEQKVKRKSDSQEDDSSNEDSSEEHANRPHVSTTFLSSSPQSSNGRVVRDTFEKPSPDKSSGGPANDDSSTVAPVLYSRRIARRDTEERSTTEKVVIVTSQSKELRRPQSLLAPIPLKTQN